MIETRNSNETLFFNGKQLEMAKFWEDILEMFRESRIKQDLLGLSKSLELIHGSVTSALRPNDDKVVLDLVNELFLFSTEYPLVDVALQVKSSKLFLNITKNPYQREKIHLSYERVIYVFNKLFFNKKRYNLHPSTDVLEMFEFFFSLHFYFSNEDGEKILNTYIHEVGYNDMNSIKSACFLMTFLPRSFLPRIIDTIMFLLKNRVSSIVSGSCIYYIASAVTEDIVSIDWRPHLGSIIDHLLQCIGPSIKVLDNEVSIGNGADLIAKALIMNSTFSSVSTISYIARFLIAILRPDENGKAVLEQLSKLFPLLVKMIQSGSKCDKNTAEFVKILINAADNHVRQVMRLRKAGKNTQLFNKEQAEELVRIVLPFITTALFSSAWRIQKIIVPTVGILADLAFDVINDDILQFSLQHMNDTEVTGLSQTCFVVVSNLVRYMLLPENIDKFKNQIGSVFDATISILGRDNGVDYDHALKILSQISSSIFASKSDKHRSIEIEWIQKSGMIVDLIFQRESVLSDSKKEEKEFRFNFSHNFKLISYFSSFRENSSKLLTNQIIENINSPKFPPTVIYSILRSFSLASPSIATKKIFPILVDQYKSSNENQKVKNLIALSSLLTTHQSMEDILPFFFSEISSLMNQGKKGIKLANILVKTVAEALSNKSISNWSIVTPSDENQEAFAKDPSLFWGRRYNKHNIQPQWFSFSDTIIEDFLKLIGSIIFEKINNIHELDAKTQKHVFQTIQHLIPLLTMRRKADSTTPSFLTPQSAHLYKSLFENFNKWLNQNDICNNSLFLERVLSLITNFCQYSIKTKNSYRPTESKFKELLKKSKSNYPLYRVNRFFALWQIQFAQNMNELSYMPDIDPEFDSLIDMLFSFLKHPSNPVTISAGQILNIFCFSSKRINTEYVEKFIDELENQKYSNEYELKGILRYLNDLSFVFTVKRTDLIVRLIRALATIQYDKQWNINSQIICLVNTIEKNRPITSIKFSEEWEKLLSDIPTIPYTIGDKSYYFLVRFCVYQSSQIPPNLIIYLLQNSRSSLNAHRNYLMTSLSYILARVKPVAPKILKSSVSGENDFNDRSSVGFYSMPHEFKLYSGPAVFDAKFETLQRTVQEVCDFEFINQLLSSMVTLHTDTNPQIQLSFAYLWKGLTQFLGNAICQNMLDVILNMMNGSNASFVTACEFLLGLVRGSKHWLLPQYDEMCQSILKPVISFIAQSKRYDCQISVETMLRLIIADRDYRRFNWLTQFLIQMIDESPDDIIKNVVNIASICFSEMSWRFTSQYSDILLNHIIPRFVPFNNKSNQEISNFGYFLRARTNYLLCPMLSDQDRSWIIKALEIIISETTNVDQLSLFFSKFFENPDLGNSYLLPTIGKHFQKFIELVSNTTTQYQKGACDTIILIAYLPWHLYQETLNKLSTLIIQMLPSMPWYSKNVLVGFLHIVVFTKMYILPKEFLTNLLEQIMPHFLLVDINEVREQALDLFRMLIHLIYSTEESMDQYVHHIINGMKENDQKSIIASAGIIGFVTISQKCPKWLPDLFAAAEEKYSNNHPLSKQIESAAKNFWASHQYHEIPELEDYRFAFFSGYFC